MTPVTAEFETFTVTRRTGPGRQWYQVGITMPYRSMFRVGSGQPSDTGEFPGWLVDTQFPSYDLAVEFVAEMTPLLKQAAELRGQIAALTRSVTEEANRLHALYRVETNP